MFETTGPEYIPIIYPHVRWLNAHVCWLNANHLMIRP